MKSFWGLLVVVLCSVSVVRIDETAGAKILAIFPTWGRSHYISGSALMKGLAAKGHEVSVISAFSQKEPVRNYRDIPVMELSNVTAIMNFLNDVEKMKEMSFIEIFNLMFTMGKENCRCVMESPAVRELLASKKEHFDVVFLEIFLSESLIGFAEHFHAPVIAFSSFGATNWHTDLVGVPSPPSFVPHTFLSYTDRMNYWERMGNMVFTAMELLNYNYRLLPAQEELYRRYFPSAKVSLDNMRKNVSLVVLNQHFSLSSPRPYVPNMIEAGGMHIKQTIDPLPKEMQEFLDSSPDGVVYFSMGSNLRSENLSPEKLQVILKTFASLPYKVMWKFENSSFPGIPSSVYINSWFPQNDILAHPNVRLFITHGGLLSTTETIYHGKPIVGIPMFGDQPMNMARAAKAGIGRVLDYNDLTEEKFRAAIVEVFENPRYTQTVQTMSRRYRDQPMSPLDTAIYWVEYVLRHQGAPHLRAAAMDLNFWQYHSLDTIAGSFVIVVGLLIYLVLALRAVYFSLKQRFCKVSKNKLH